MLSCSTSVVHLAHKVRSDQGGNLDLSPQRRRKPSVLAVCTHNGVMHVFVRTLGGRESTGTLGGECQPRCTSGRRGVMTEEDSELLQGQQADTAN